jgi:hypothetical protein
MIIIFFEIKGLFTKKKFILVSQTINLSCYCDDLWWLCENVRRLTPKTCWEQWIHTEGNYFMGDGPKLVFDQMAASDSEIMDGSL